MHVIIFIKLKPDIIFAITANILINNIKERS